jgi:hypothetical protein
VADAVISNPPTFGHIHCAEALGVPLHMMCAALLQPASSNQQRLSSQRRASSHQQRLSPHRSARRPLNVALSSPPTAASPSHRWQVPAAVDADARVATPDERPQQRGHFT